MNPMWWVLIVMAAVFVAFLLGCFLGIWVYKKQEARFWQRLDKAPSAQAQPQDDEQGDELIIITMLPDEPAQPPAVTVSVDTTLQSFTDEAQQPDDDDDFTGVPVKI